MSPFKVTGVYWMPEIPKEWSMRRAWQLFSQRKTLGGSEAPALVPSRHYGVVTQEEYSRLANRKPTGNERTKHMMTKVKPGDFIISMGSFESGIEFSQIAGKVSNHYKVLVPNSGVLEGYFRWLFKSQPLIDGIAGLAVEIRVGQEIHYSKFAKLSLPLPPLETQQRIADYLDRETAEIDAAVANLDRYMELLEKRRAALVADTLSRFARPGRSNTPGSPGANLGRVGLVSSLIRRGISPSYVDDGIPVVSQKCVRPGGKIDYEVCRFHDPNARSISKSLFIREGDVLINSTGTGTLGRSSVAREVDRETTWDSHVTLVRPNLDDVNPGYLGWVIANQESKLIKLSVGSTNQIELSRDKVVNLEIPLLSLGDQKRIADYLDRETIVIDDLIAESTRLRDLLLKRRSVLITEVVTGRRQV